VAFFIIQSNFFTNPPNFSQSDILRLVKTHNEGIFMKKTLFLMALAMSSLSVQANDITKSPLDATIFPFGMTAYSTISTGMTSSGLDYCKEAKQIIADGQEYALTGELTPFLEVNVKNVKDQLGDLSTDEAVDLLIEKAVSILE
jgi:hypothetical protein